MLRPLDQALIDLEKTYRQIFKQPLHEHEQYTKRQLIYNYAEIGSQFIHELIKTKIQKGNQNQTDLSQIIKQWNNKTVTVEQMLQEKQKGEQATQKLLPNPLQQEDKTFLKQIQVVKKDKLITKSRNQRNVNYRKQLQILFKSRNVNMLNVQSMRNHFSQLKPYNNFYSKNKNKKYQDNYQEKYQDRYQDKYEQKYQDRNQQRWTQKERYQKMKYEQSKNSDDQENYQQNYTLTNVKKESFNYRSPNQKYGRQNDRRQYSVKREEGTRFQTYQRDPALPPRYKSPYQFRPPAFFPPPEPYSSVSQFVPSSEFSRQTQQQSYRKYPQQEANLVHNQFYPQNFPKPYQPEMNPTSNNTQNSNGSNYRDYRGSYGSRTDLKGQYRTQ